MRMPSPDNPVFRNLFFAPLMFFMLIGWSNNKLWAADYSIFGSAGISGIQTEVSSQVSREMLGKFEAEHSLQFPWGKAFLYHEIQGDLWTPEMESGQEGNIRNILYQGGIAFYGNASVLGGFGKQTIPWGTGILFHPSDCLNPNTQKDDKTGFPGGYIQWLPGPSESLSAAISLENLEEYGPRIGVHGTMDIGTVHGFLSMMYQENNIKRPGSGFSLEVLNFIVYGEGAWELDEKSKELLGTGGLEYTKYLGDFTIICTGEYLYQENRDDEIALSAGLEYLDLGKTEANFMYDKEDKSYSSSAEIWWTVAQDLELGLTGTMFHGNKNTLFGASQMKYQIETEAKVHF